MVPSVGTTRFLRIFPEYSWLSQAKVKRSQLDPSGKICSLTLNIGKTGNILYYIGTYNYVTELSVDFSL